MVQCRSLTLYSRILALHIGRAPRISSAYDLQVGIFDILHTSFADIVQRIEGPLEFLNFIRLTDLSSEIVSLDVVPIERCVSDGCPYMTYFGTADPTRFTRLMQLDQQLISWRSSLPTSLIFDLHTTAAASTPHVTTRVTYLQTHYLHCQILLFRPILARLCLARSGNFATTPNLPRQMALTCSAMCVDAALSTINTSYASFDLRAVGSAVPLWWHTVHYLYSAATVLQAARLCADLDSTTDNAEEIGAAWTKVLEMLSKYEDLRNGSSRAMVALELVKEKVDQVTGPRNFEVNNNNNNNNNNNSARQPSDAAETVLPGISAALAATDESEVDISDMSWLITPPSTL